LFLGATTTPHAVGALLRRPPGPDGWVITVQDGAGRVIARAHDDARIVAPPLPDGLRQAMLRQPSGVLKETTSAGIPVLTAYTQSAYTGWSVSAGIPQHGLMRDLNATLAVMCVSIVVIVGIGVLAATLVARGIRSAIAALVPAAEALSRSEPLDLPAVTYEETRQLGAALARTSEKLRYSEYHAQHDVLTGLPNRVFLQTVLPRLQSQAIRNRSTLTLLYLDLDGFKEVNDGLGHAAGDEVLFQAAERIREAIRGADIGIRLGGDEFAVLLPDTDRPGAQAIAERIRVALAVGVETRAGPARVSASIGLAAFPDDCSAVDDLVTLADAAMYRAKRHGKNTVCSAQEIVGAGDAKAQEMT
jgi:diguanylate cyclase (GGDEF)-like protein